MAYSNSFKSAQSSIVYHSDDLQHFAGKNGTNNKGTAARNRRAHRRSLKRTGMNHISCEVRMQLFNSRLNRGRSLRGAWKAQVTKYYLEMLQWVYSDLLELSSYWDEDQAMMSRLSGYEKVAFYQFQILVSLETKKPSLTKKAWDFLNQEVSLTPLVEGLVISAISLGIAGPVAVMITAHTETTSMNPCIVETPLCRTIIK